MDDRLPATAISPLRQRLIDDMSLRRFSRQAQRNYIRDVGRLATFLGRPDMATAEDLRRFQVAQREAGVTETYSNGQAEGLITRLNLVMRRVYGLAKIDLLEARLIGAAWGHLYRECARPRFGRRSTLWL